LSFNSTHRTIKAVFEFGDLLMGQQGRPEYLVKCRGLSESVKTGRLKKYPKLIILAARVGARETKLP
jgi:hypothetical protein